MLCNATRCFCIYYHCFFYLLLVKFNLNNDFLVGRGVCVLKKDYFILGWVYFGLMFVLEAVLPEWMGNENGVIENLQILWLFIGIWYCYKMASAPRYDWGGRQSALWYAGSIFFLLLAGREVSWGRALLHHADGRMYKYSDMGLYGQLVHPMVGALLVLVLFLLWRGKIVAFLKAIKFPTVDFVLLLLFILMGWIGEKADIALFHGMVAEELAEFGAYMMMFQIVRRVGEYMQNKK